MASLFGYVLVTASSSPSSAAEAQDIPVFPHMACSEVTVSRIVVRAKRIHEHSARLSGPSQVRTWALTYMNKCGVVQGVAEVPSASSTFATAFSPGSQAAASSSSHSRGAGHHPSRSLTEPLTGPRGWERGVGQAQGGSDVSFPGPHGV